MYVLPSSQTVNPERSLGHCHIGLTTMLRPSYH